MAENRGTGGGVYIGEAELGREDALGDVFPNRLGAVRG